MFTLNRAAIFAFFTIMNFLNYKLIDRGMQISSDSSTYETSIDLFVLNTFVEFTTCFYEVFWYFYLIVPGYMLYKLLRWCLGSATDIKYVEDDAAGGKGQKEKKKDKERTKIKYIKR